MANRKRIGAFTPEQATELIAFMREVKASGLYKRQVVTPVPDTPESYRVSVFNDSSEQIPPYACMQIDGTFQLGNQTYVKVVKPTKTDGVYLFNNERTIYGKSSTNSMPWGVVRMLTNVDPPSFTAGAEFAPVPGQWYVEEASGPFVGYGPDENKKKVIAGVISAGLRLYRFALTASLSGGTASATIKDMAGTTIKTDTIRDPEAIFTELVSGDTGLAIGQGGKFYVIQAPCGA